MGVSAATTWLSLMTIGACAQTRGAATASAVAARAVRRVVVAVTMSLLGCSIRRLWRRFSAPPRRGMLVIRSRTRGQLFASVARACFNGRGPRRACRRDRAPPQAMDPSDPYAAWLGRTEERQRHRHAAPLAALAATLDRDDPPPRAGDAAAAALALALLPAAWRRQRELGADGHPRRGGFLPPVPLPRRMWAGGRLAFHAPLRVGDALTRTLAHRRRRRRSRARRAARLRHRAARDRDAATASRSREEHDIVYRDLPAPGGAAPRAEPAPPDETLRARRSCPTTCCCSAIRR